MRVIFRPRFEGLFKATLELIFHRTQKVSAWFVVRRKLQGVAGSLEDHKHFESLGGGEDGLSAIKSRSVSPQKTILLLSPDRRRKSRFFPNYEVLPLVQEAVDKSAVMPPYNEHAPSLISALIPDSLKMSTYAHYFNALLAVEDGHQQYVSYFFSSIGSNIWAGGMSCASLPMGLKSKASAINTCELHFVVLHCIFVYHKAHSIEIENNEDLLPEVAPGDFLWLDDLQDDIRYEARVTDVDVFMRRHLAVLRMSLSLPTDFYLHKGSKFDLRFRHNRFTLRRQYRALTAALAPPRRLLFPSMSDFKPLRRLSRAEIDDLKYRQLVNKDIRDDSQQLQAVISILEQPQGSVPFIICGP